MQDMTHEFLPGLKLLLFRDGNEFVAHLLDFDLVGTGSTREEAIQAVCEAAAAQLAYAIETRAPEKVFKPAPKAFYDKWNRAGHRAIMNILVASKTTSRKSPRKYEALELPTSALV